MTIKAYLVLAEHWDVPGAQRAIRFTEDEADDAARVFTNRLISEVQPAGQYSLREGVAVPALVESGQPWKGGMAALIRALLIDRGDEETADATLAETSAEELMNDRSEELPCVWIEEVTDVALPVGALPAALEAVLEAGEDVAGMLEDAIDTHIYDVGEEPDDAPERAAVEDFRRLAQVTRFAAVTAPAAGCDDPELIETAAAIPSHPRPPVRVAIGLSGGAFQWALADGPGARVQIIDFDVEGHTDFDLTLVTDKDGDTSPANVFDAGAEIDPLYFVRLDTATTHVNGTGAAYGDDEEDQKPNPRHWLIWAYIDVQGEGGGIESYSGYIPGDTEEEARQLAYALIERRYGPGTRVFSIGTSRPAQDAS